MVHLSSAIDTLVPLATAPGAERPALVQVGWVGALGGAGVLPMRIMLLCCVCLVAVPSDAATLLIKIYVLLPGLLPHPGSCARRCCWRRRWRDSGLAIASIWMK